jgi:antitoxin ParD1/3/4
VASGAYVSSSDVVRDALHFWEQSQEIQRLEICRLKAAYDEGMARGEGREVDARHLLAELKSEARSRGEGCSEPKGRTGSHGHLVRDCA